MAFQLSDDIMDMTASQVELGKEPGTDLREGVYTLPVLHALAEGDHRDELQRLLTHGAPDGERLDRALEIVRTGGAVVHAAAAVAAEVRRAVGARRATSPTGRRAHALIQLAKYLGGALRCGGRRVRIGRRWALLRYGPPFRGPFASVVPSVPEGF